MCIVIPIHDVTYMALRYVERSTIVYIVRVYSMKCKYTYCYYIYGIIVRRCTCVCVYVCMHTL